MKRSELYQDEAQTIIDSQTIAREITSQLMNHSLKDNIYIKERERERVKGEEQVDKWPDSPYNQRAGLACC